MTVLLMPLIGAFAALVILAAIKDVASLTIPNWLCGTVAVLFVPAALAAGLSPAQWGVHLGVGVATLFLGVGLFAMRALGGGDAKLLGAAALWLGWPAAGAFLLWTAVGGGVFAIGLLTLRKMAPAFAGFAPPWAVRLLERGSAVPYGVAIAFGALMALPQSMNFSALS